MNPKFFPVIIAMAFAFAGCLGIGDDDELETDETEPGAQSNTNDEGDDVGQEDEADAPGDGDPRDSSDPISLSAQLDANLSSGAFPLPVTFTLAGEYPDEMEAAWSFDPGDGSETETGSDLPFELVHTYQKAGNYTAAFTISVEDDSASDDLTIMVEEPELVESGPNEPQSGTNTFCLDYLVLWALNEDPGPGGTHSPLGESLVVEAGTGYTMASADGEPAIDFFNADGFYVANGGDSGTVPTDAAYGIACVGVLGEWPEPPFPMGEYTYQDGF